MDFDLFFYSLAAVILTPFLSSINAGQPFGVTFLDADICVDLKGLSALWKGRGGGEGRG